ncbi:hypothetical protein HZA40_03795 [Candidatus Peregrinibacteria bacterium]|nr:hypothetical protein [Candidatus Peregrinibacteria bacterium]
MSNTLLKLGKSFKNLVILDTGSMKNPVSEEFLKFFGERYFGFGLAESNMISAAAGFAIAGKTPIVLGSARFLLSTAFDQIYNDICLPNLNVKIVGLGGGDVDLELARILPNMKVMEDVGEHLHDVSDESFLTKKLEELLMEYGPAYLRIF